MTATIVRDDELDLDVIARCEWVAALLHQHPELATTVEDGHASRRIGVTLVVAGGPAEVRAWHRHVGGLVRPHVSRRGVWSQLILASCLCITVRHDEVAA